MNKTLEAVLAEAITWSQDAFPLATQRSRAVHLAREAAELAEDPTDEEEMADCAILLFQIVHHAGVDLAAAVAAKLEKNRARQWGTPDADGVVEHVR